MWRWRLRCCCPVGGGRSGGKRVLCRAYRGGWKPAWKVKRRGRREGLHLWPHDIRITHSSETHFHVQMYILPDMRILLTSFPSDMNLRYTRCTLSPSRTPLLFHPCYTYRSYYSHCIPAFPRLFLPRSWRQPDIRSATCPWSPRAHSVDSLLVTVDMAVRASKYLSRGH